MTSSVSLHTVWAVWWSVCGLFVITLISWFVLPVKANCTPVTVSYVVSCSIQLLYHYAAKCLTVSSKYYTIQLFYTLWQKICCSFMSLCTKSKPIKTWLAKVGEEALECPVQNSDLNLTKHLWTGMPTALPGLVAWPQCLTRSLAFVAEWS